MTSATRQEQIICPMCGYVCKIFVYVGGGYSVTPETEFAHMCKNSFGATMISKMELYCGPLYHDGFQQLVDKRHFNYCLNQCLNQF